MKIELLANAVSAYVDNHTFTLALLVGVVVSELILRMYVRRLRIVFNSKKENLTDEAKIEKLSIDYYSKKQRTIMARSVILISVVFLSILYYDVRAFSFFAVAVGAIIMTFKESVVSMISYFYILRTYHIGDDIRVNGVRGEILNIRPSATTVLGKEDDGEYNGKVTSIQNFQLVTNSVERQEMKSHSYLMAQISIPFESKTFNVPFKEFMEKLKKHLDGMLPSRGVNNVGYYRSYAGVRYKMNYTYDNDARVVVHISFVSKPRRIADRKENIIAFVESCKK